MPESYEDIIARLVDVPLGEMSPTERSEWNQASWNVGPHRLQAIIDRYKRPPGAAEAAKAREGAGVDDSALADAAPGDRACAVLTPAAPQDHAALELEARGLYGESLKSLRTILRDHDATNQDRLQAASHLRLAAGIGASDPAPAVYVLPMASLLGAEEPTDAVADRAKDDKGST